MYKLIKYRLLKKYKTENEFNFYNNLVELQGSHNNLRNFWECLVEPNTLIGYNKYMKGIHWTNHNILR